MKVIKGKLVLTKVDYRVGNMVFSDFSEHIQVQDINSTMVLKVAKRIPAGFMLADAIRTRNDKYLHNWAATMYNVTLCAHDVQSMVDLNKSVKECYERHAEIYGAAPASDEEEAGIIREEKELHEALENAEKDGEGEGDGR